MADVDVPTICHVFYLHQTIWARIEITKSFVKYGNEHFGNEHLVTNIYVPRRLQNKTVVFIKDSFWWQQILSYVQYSLWTAVAFTFSVSAVTNITVLNLRSDFFCFSYWYEWTKGIILNVFTFMWTRRPRNVLNKDFCIF